jgi:hypothetical protein
MPNHSLVVEALVKTRADVSGLVRKTQAELDKLLADLRAIDRTLEIHGYTEHATDIPSRQRFMKQNLEALMERCNFIKRTLAAAPAPMRCADIAMLYRETHAVAGTDMRTRDYYRNRINAALRSLQTRGEVVMEGERMTALWKLAR